MDTMHLIQRRIHTAHELHSLVRTMKAMAAVNIRQLEQAVGALTEFNRTVELGLQAVLRDQTTSNLTLKSRQDKSLGAVIVGSDQGMCGQLNDQIVSLALDFVGQLEPLDKLASLAIGARVAARFEDAGQTLDAILPAASCPDSITPVIQDVLMTIDNWHSQQGISRIVVFYCEHTSRSAYQPRAMPILPLDSDWLDQLRQNDWPTNQLPRFSMDRDRLLSRLVRQYLFVSLFRACAETFASENASRLAAMQSAENNITERIDELTRTFHQTRQMAITEELLDITSGFEALESASQ